MALKQDLSAPRPCTSRTGGSGRVPMRSSEGDEPRTRSCIRPRRSLAAAETPHRASVARSVVGMRRLGWNTVPPLGGASDLPDVIEVGASRLDTVVMQFKGRTRPRAVAIVLWC